MVECDEEVRKGMNTVVAEEEKKKKKHERQGHVIVRVAGLEGHG